MKGDTTNATVSGTYRYMAPEVYMKKPYDNTVDIYSLGLVLLMVSGTGFAEPNSNGIYCKCASRMF